MIVGLVLALAVPVPCATAQDTPDVDDPFPRYPLLEGHVEFWKRVFAEWSMGQVAVHDLEHPGVVYEVVSLDGRLEFPYTDEQRDFVDELRESWEDRLEALERKIAKGKKLSDDDKALALVITTGAGTDAVDDAHKRVRTQRGLKEQFERGLETSGKYLNRFRRIFREAGLPEDLAYLPHVESSFQELARSSAGAAGMWQFTKGTGRNYLTVTSVVDERLDPVTAAYGAARYLKAAHDTLGTWPLALTSYNHGVAGIGKAKRQFGTDFERIVFEYRSRSFGFASRNFYAEFLAARDIALAPADYFPDAALKPPLSLVEMSLPRRTSPGQLARMYALDIDELAVLNPAWSRRAVQNGYALPSGMRVWLPAGSLERRGTFTAARVEHVVRRGENLSTIAARYGTTASELRKLNGISSRSSLIHPGQTLVIVPEIEASGGTAFHIVRRGENLSTIAARYGMSVSDLRKLNGMSSSHSLIRAKQKLVVRGGDADTVHVVTRGDTLTEIAAEYGVPLSDILAANRLGRKSVIHPGQEIRIP
jgi:membrane-bound lytic murein transglycosylase D